MLRQYSIFTHQNTIQVPITCSGLDDCKNNDVEIPLCVLSDHSFSINRYGLGSRLALDSVYNIVYAFVRVDTHVHICTIKCSE